MLKSIKNQVMFTCIFLCITSIALVTFVSYSRYTSLIAYQIEITASNTLNNNKREMEAILQDIDRMTESFIFQQFYVEKTAHNAVNPLTLARQIKRLGKNPLSDYEYLTMWRSMQFLANNLFYEYQYINGIYLFAYNDQVFSYTRRGTDLALNYSPLQDEWYQKTIEQKGKLYISTTGVKPFIINAKPSITFSRVVQDTNSGEFLGVLMLDCNLNIFSRLDNHTLPDTIGVMLLNNEGEALYTSGYQNMMNDTLIGALSERIKGVKEGSFESDDKQHRNMFITFDERDWKLLTTVSIEKLNSQFGATRRLLFFSAGSGLIIVTILLFLISKWLTKPITVLANHMHNHSMGQSHQEMKYASRKNEVGVLFSEYFNMLEQNRRFIKESYENRLILLDSQMKALESQINSHFLYNTLESMNSIAEIEEIPSVAIMSKSLGDMFRYAIKTESELVLVDEELTHVLNYISIQKIRHEDKLDFDYHIPHTIRRLRILKLILQPIVENAIYHGLEGKVGKGNLTIEATLTDGRLCFIVADNGTGMTVSQLESINRLLAEEPHFEELGKRSGSSIGLKNVHSRIQLYYGLEYGLQIESELGKGTRVIITIPIHKSEKVECACLPM